MNARTISRWWRIRRAREEHVLGTFALNEATEVVGELTSAGVWFLTKASPSSMSYPCRMSVFDFFFPISDLIRLYGNLRRDKKSIETDTMFEHAAVIYCARTQDDFVFIACKAVFGIAELTHVLRRFPVSTLISCNYDRSHKTPVKFVFEGSESFTLRFEGVWSDLAEFIEPGSAMANPPSNKATPDNHAVHRRTA